MEFGLASFKSVIVRRMPGSVLTTSKKEQEEAIRKAVDCSTTASQTVDWSDLPCEGRFWERKLAPAKTHYL
jgi:hypothetical protein